MNYSEIGVADPQAGLDGEGYFHLTRTFEVWDISPRAFFTSHTQITDFQTGNIPLPTYGHVIDLGKPPFVAEPVKAPMYLYDWELRPKTPATFFAIAHYTNDPKRVPGGVDYHSASMKSFVPVPYVYQQPIINLGASGSGSAGPYSLVPDVLNMPMSVERISHTVTVERSLLATVELSIEKAKNTLHKLPIKATPCAFDCGSVRMRGVQYLEVTYNWIWEAGVPDFSRINRAVRRYQGSADDPISGTYVDAPLKATYPDKIKPLTTVLGQDYWLVPPYHIINQIWAYQSDASFIRVPEWVYTQPYFDGALTGWSSLPGAKNFIWGGP